MANNNRYVNLSDQDALFKEFYGEAGRSVVNAKTPLASILMKNKNAQWVGSEFVEPIRMTSGLGLGYRALGENLPAPNSAIRQKAFFTAKRAYATAEFDREAIVASRNDRGAFAKVTVDEVEATQEGFMVNMIERALFGDSTGKLGEIESVDSGSGTTSSPWVVTMENDGTVAPKFKKNYFPVGSKMDVYSQAGLLQCTVQVVGKTSTTLSLVLISTAADTAPAADDVLYWEGNKDKEIVGLKLICPDSAGTLYGISQAQHPDFRGGVKTISGGLQYDDVNDGIEAVAEESGEDPNIGICSHKAFSLLKNLSEDQKRYAASEAKASDGKIGFKGIEFVHGTGSFPMVPSQMCPDDEIFLLNTKYLQLVLRQDFGWFDDDGKVLLRDSNKDLYNARYGGYFELYCSKPNAQYRIKGFNI